MNVNVEEELDPWIDPPDPSDALPPVDANAPPVVAMVLAKRAVSWNPKVLKFGSVTVTVKGIAGPPGVYVMPDGKPEMEVLPPEEALPPWQPAHVFAVGFEELKDACPGVAETVGTLSCAPNRTRIIRALAMKMNNGMRNFFNLEPPQ